MALKRLQKKLTKENLWIYILTLLRDEPLYAYQIKEKIKERFGFEPATITCYAVLYRLEMEGLVESKTEKGASNNIVRRYYRLTEKGLRTVEAGKEFLKKVVHILESSKR